LGTQEVMIGNVGGRFYAIDEICTHEGGPLHEGTLEGTTVTCPWHEGQYSIETGEANPETDWVRDTKSFPTQVRDGWVWADASGAMTAVVLSLVSSRPPPPSVR